MDNNLPEMKALRSLIPATKPSLSFLATIVPAKRETWPNLRGLSHEMGWAFVDLDLNKDCFAFERKSKNRNVKKADLTQTEISPKKVSMYVTKSIPIMTQSLYFLS